MPQLYIVDECRYSFVSAVHAGSVAGEAGLQVDDIILRINSAPTKSPAHTMHVQLRERRTAPRLRPTPPPRASAPRLRPTPPPHASAPRRCAHAAARTSRLAPCQVMMAERELEIVVERAQGEAAAPPSLDQWGCAHRCEV